jgi:lysozyme
MAGPPLASTAVVVILFVLAFNNGYVRFRYPSGDKYPVHGVDISHHQGHIDWPKLTGENRVSFAFMKASEGTDLQDPRFRENWDRAEGLTARSAYHFFTFCSPGEPQARNFLASAPEPGELARAIDVEFGGNCTRWTSIDAIRTELNAFIEVVRREDGRDPILYVTRQSYMRIVKGHVEGVPIWIREVFLRPDEEDYPGLMFWQYSGNSRMEGVDTLIDRNVFWGSEEEFAALTG